MTRSAGAISYGKEQINFRVMYVARKTLGIEVFPDSSVVVKAPADSEFTEILKRVTRRVRWILRQQHYFRQFDPRTPARQFIGGETHLYLGRQYRLMISTGTQDSVKLSKGCFLVEIKGELSPEKTRTLLNRWYADKAASTFQKSFVECWPYFEKLELTQPKVQIRRMKKRWGSLSRSGILTLNTDLIRAPKECIDYVITHELCHLQFHDHGAEFCRLLEKIMPDWEKRKHKLELALV